MQVWAVHSLFSYKVYDGYAICRCGRYIHYIVIKVMTLCMCGWYIHYKVILIIKVMTLCRCGQYIHYIVTGIFIIKVMMVMQVWVVHTLIK